MKNSVLFLGILLRVYIKRLPVKFLQLEECHFSWWYWVLETLHRSLKRCFF